MSEIDFHPLAVEGSIPRVADLDMLDGTPLGDIKSYVPAFDSFPASRIGWLNTAKGGSAVADCRFEATTSKRKRL